ncbi:MAG: ribosome small subunit-dependent GTPase A [Anaerolineae bacterium]|jgi:ribosome biogenesis GTPase|nr:ribosome small subunit-dependent GTPase A [Anaerolineae bacterium]MBT4308901.1 ribosome small subunit-dependent GTPase A [Anaerolineae bacterium]MBT4459052.1 ribosome small subunit-dependent GTPase A [Anaerolineae bacterium]MBT6061211.1 ribosome small subunit-dependent GTPase A [Anaerolineae bacterium]MBT6320790.1 ribosome small subunit-dependent GTPase A [Anaerolineae bacterium]
MNEKTLQGLIIKSQSGFFDVKTTEANPISCQLRGRLKQGGRKGDLLAVGDRVRISILPEGTGMIEEILPRERAIVRMDPRPRGLYKQILLANPDQAVFVFACTNPSPRLRMLDRFLVIAEQQEIPAVIVANKVDLLGEEEAKKIFGHYAKIGYKVLYTSAQEKTGIDILRYTLEGKLSALAGPSGVGKSSLMNTMQPGLGLEVEEISQSLNRGKHTTNFRQLLPLEGGGYVADTPGWKALALWDTEPEELDGYFPEIAQLVPLCRFNDCSHVHEPGCAVLDAVRSGELHSERFNSFIRMRDGLSNKR